MNSGPRRNKVAVVSAKAIQSLCQVVDDILGMLKPDREAEQPCWSHGFQTLNGRTMLNERMCPAEACGPSHELKLTGDNHRRLSPTFNNKGQHRTVAAHLPLRERMARIVRQAGEQHLFDIWMSNQSFRHLLRILAMCPHSERQGLQTPQSQPTVEGRSRTSLVLLNHAQRSFQW